MYNKTQMLIGFHKTTAVLFIQHTYRHLFRIYFRYLMWFSQFFHYWIVSEHKTVQYFSTGLTAVWIQIQHVTRICAELWWNDEIKMRESQKQQRENRRNWSSVCRNAAGEMEEEWNIWRLFVFGSGC